MSPSRLGNRRPAPTLTSILYPRENALTCLKSPCGVPDTQARFFLHVVPEAVEDLPAHRRQYGFNDLDFHYDGHGSMPALVFDGRWSVGCPIIALPASEPGSTPLAKAKSGKAEFPVHVVKDETAVRSTPGRAPGS